MVAWETIVEATAASVLVGGLVYASIADWRTREVADELWVLLAGIGTVLGAFLVSPGGLLPLTLWIVAAALVLEHLLPWDVRVERVHPSLPGYIELAVYGGVLALLVYTGVVYGVSNAGLPVAVIAVYVTVILARVLFETGILYGGADAKALMIAGILVPVFSTPVVAVPATAEGILALYPFSISVLMNAALFALAVPIGLALRNARKGEFVFPRGFTGYRIPVSELPHRYVWLRDPLFSRDLTEEERAVSTTEEDNALRLRQMRELQAKGVDRVWVTPQIPFVVLLSAGAIAALLVGNVLFDLFALL